LVKDDFSSLLLSYLSLENLVSRMILDGIFNRYTFSSIQ